MFLKRGGGTRSGVLIVSVLLALALPSCGGGGSPAEPSTPARQVVAQGGFSIGRVGASNFVVFFPFSTSRNGQLDITVDWTFASSDLDFGVARGACDLAMVIAEQCVEVGSADSTTKPERLSIPSFQAGAYTLVIANLSSVDESGTYQVVLQP